MFHLRTLDSSKVVLISARPGEVSGSCRVSHPSEATYMPIQHIVGILPHFLQGAKRVRSSKSIRAP